MKPVRVIKTFADLRDVLSAIQRETVPVANPPMSAQQVRDAAEVFAARHRHEAARVIRRAPPNVVALKPSPEPPLTR
jgi:hypothetical protein